MPLSAEMETTEYELAISPSALDTTQLKPPTKAVASTSPLFPIPVRSGEERRSLSGLEGQPKSPDPLRPTSPRTNPCDYGDDGYTMFVADGMGGMAAGEVASRLAITTAPQARQPFAQVGLQDQQEGSSRTVRTRQASRPGDRLKPSPAQRGRSPPLRHGHDADRRLQRRRRPVHHPPRRLARLSLSKGPSPATYQGPHRCTGDGRRRLHRPRRGPPPSQAPRAHQFPGRPSRQGQRRRPLASPG